MNLLYTELTNDDGNPNQPYNVGTSNSFANKFTTTPGTEVHYAKIYVTNVGASALIFRIFDDNGTGGLPGTQLIQFTAAVSSLTTGWNNVPLPQANIITDPNGIFYIGVYEFASVSAFAIDTNSNGATFTKAGTTGAWTPLTTGNVMLRALVINPVANDDVTEITPVATLSNYPNPFSQKTDISFDLSKSGPAKLSIYNLKGQLVRAISTGTLDKGTHSLSWDGTDLNGHSVAPGVYYIRLESSGTALTRKVLRID